MAARSKRLVGPVVIGSALTQVYECPNGKVALVKWVRLVVWGDAGLFSLVWSDGVTVDDELAFHRETILPHQTILTDESQVILHAGEQLHASYSIDAAATLTISGAELEA